MKSCKKFSLFFIMMLLFVSIGMLSGCDSGSSGSDNNSNNNNGTNTGETRYFSENFSTGVPGKMQAFDADGQDSLTWVSAEYGTDVPCAKMSAYDSGNTADEEWLISPVMDLSDASTPVLSFSEALGYIDAGDVDTYCKVLYSADYTGTGDPNNATWAALSLDTRADGSSWDFVDVSGDLSSLKGESAVYIAFKYTSTTSVACTWELDTILVEENSAEHLTVSDKSLALNSNEGTASDYETVTISGFNLIQDINIAVTDSTNFEISADSGTTWGSTAAIVQTSGTASGTIFVRIKDSAQTGSLTASVICSVKTVSATITVSGNVIANGGSSSLSTEFAVVPDVFSTYDADGDDSYTWVFATYGDDSQCAKMSGYSGGSNADEEWLISPKMNFTSLSTPTLKFSEAVNYASGAVDTYCKVLYSTDYTGTGDPNNATWTEFSIGTRSGGAAWDFVDVSVDLSSLAGQSSVYFAFKYISTTSVTATWEIDWVEIKEDTSERIYVDNESVTLSTNEGTASDSKNISVNGVNLSNNISVSITDSTNFEISVDGGTTWGATAAISQASGLASGVVDVRIKSTATAETPSADISLSTGTVTATIAVSGTVVMAAGRTSLSTEFAVVPDVFSTYDADGDDSYTWKFATYGDDSQCAKMSAYSGGSNADEEWLISPKMNFSSLTAPTLEFSEAVYYASGVVDTYCKVLYSTDYTGTGDPNNATWTEFSIGTRSSGGAWDFVDVSVDLSSLSGQSSVYFAFKYISTASLTATWEIDWIKIGE